MAGTLPQPGQYRKEETSSEGLCCGVFALAISTAQQLGRDECLRPWEFVEIFLGEACQAFNRRMGWQDVTNNFYDEQLNFVLREWGRRRGLRLRLGVVWELGGPFVNPAPEGEGREEWEGEEEEDRTTVWIHNDCNAFVVGRGFNHYSGITLEAPTSMVPVQEADTKSDVSTRTC